MTVTAPGFTGAADARVTLTGTVTKIADPEDAKAAREAYLAKHPDAFWVDFGDFAWHRMDAVVGARLVGGFARAGGVDGEAYFEGAPDPVAAFATPIASHMNADHRDSIVAMTKHYVGLTVEDATSSASTRSMNLRDPRRRDVQDPPAVRDARARPQGGQGSHGGHD